MPARAPGKEPTKRPERAWPAAVAGADSELVLASVSKAFATRSATISALSDLTLSVTRNEVVGVVGPSGCGKSTLLELISGLDTPTGGRIEIEGRTQTADRLRRCALMPQRDLLLPWRSALDNAALALELAGNSRAQARRGARPLFDRFGLAGFAEARPGELSGGMRQRVAFLRTLLSGKPVLLLDEPFGALDSITRANMQEWLAEALASEPRTVLLVTHDVEEALFCCDRVAILSPRPGTVRAEIEVKTPRSLPRDRTVTSASFTALKQRALEALA